MNNRHIYGEHPPPPQLEHQLEMPGYQRVSQESQVFQRWNIARSPLRILRYIKKTPTTKILSIT